MKTMQIFAGIVVKAWANSGSLLLLMFVSVIVGGM